MLKRRGFLKLAGAAWLGLIGLFGFGTGAEAMGRPRLQSYRLTPSGWPDGLKLKVVVLTDFHACEPWMSVDRLASICDHANTLGGDIILLLGDFATSMKFLTSKSDPDAVARVMATLKAPLGVHAILGNHDYWSDWKYQRDPTRMTRVEEALTGAGIPVYVNRSVRLEKDGHGFWLAGLGDQIARLPKPGAARQDFIGIEDMDLTLADVRDDAPVILMAHEPYVFSVLPERIKLTLSGHTHGGQINIFGWAPFARNPEDHRYLVGHITRGDQHLIVSRGLGCSGIPVRLGSWPEINIIDLG